MSNVAEYRYIRCRYIRSGMHGRDRKFAGTNKNMSGVAKIVIPGVVITGVHCITFRFNFVNTGQTLGRIISLFRLKLYVISISAFYYCYFSDSLNNFYFYANVISFGCCCFDQ